MGLFKKSKREPNPFKKIAQNPAVQGLLRNADLDNMRAEFENLVAVGRKDDAVNAFKEFLTKYANEAPRGKGIERDALARVSYAIAYNNLPDLIHHQWEEFCSLWNGVIPMPLFLAIKGANGSGKQLSLGQIQEFEFYGGTNNKGDQTFLFEFPRPPEDGGREGSLEALMAAMQKGEKPSLDSIPVLGPYYAAVVVSAVNQERQYFILGQTSPGESETTLRSVSPDGMNMNLGPGPSNPTASAFLSFLECH